MSNCPDEVASRLLAILGRTLLSARARGCSGDARGCASEMDHVHNLPGLLREFSWDRLRYYLEVERVCYLEREAAVPPGVYREAWEALEARLARAAEEQAASRVSA